MDYMDALKIGFLAYLAIHLGWWVMAPAMVLMPSLGPRVAVLEAGISEMRATGE